MMAIAGAGGGLPSRDFASLLPLNDVQPVKWKKKVSRGKRGPWRSSRNACHHLARCLGLSDSAPTRFRPLPRRKRRPSKAKTRPIFLVDSFISAARLGQLHRCATKERISWLPSEAQRRWAPTKADHNGQITSDKSNGRHNAPSDLQRATWSCGRRVVTLSSLFVCLWRLFLAADSSTRSSTGGVVHQLDSYTTKSHLPQNKWAEGRGHSVAEGGVVSGSAHRRRWRRTIHHARYYHYDGNFFRRQSSNDTLPFDFFGDFHLILHLTLFYFYSGPYLGFSFAPEAGNFERKFKLGRVESKENFPFFGVGRNSFFVCLRPTRDVTCCFQLNSSGNEFFFSNHFILFLSFFFHAQCADIQESPGRDADQNCRRPQRGKHLICMSVH